MALMGTLTDTFTTAFDTAKWSRTTTAIVNTSGQLHIPTDVSTHRASSLVSYDLTNSAAMVEVVNKPATASVLLVLRTVVGSGTNELHINLASNGFMATAHVVAGVTTEGSLITYSPTNHRWLRIRHASGTLFYEASPDSVAWTQIWSTTPTLAITALFVELQSGAAAATTDAVFDNFNNGIGGAPTGGTVNWWGFMPRAISHAGIPTGAGTLLFNGDFSTNSFSQWPVVQNQDYNDVGTGYAPVSYAATVQNDATYGKAARFEVRDGDIAVGAVDEMSEVAGGASTGGVEGDIRWYEFATKFDTGFPTNHASSGFWGLTDQWHHVSTTGSPPLGWYVDKIDGQWSLVVNRQSAPGTYIDVTTIYNCPLVPTANGGWNDVRMEIRWSISDAVGYIRLWHNGNRVTFTNGSQTYNVRTLVPGDTAPGGSHYVAGYTRDAAMTQSGAVLHANFKAADAEAPLGTLMAPVTPPVGPSVNRPANPAQIIYGSTTGNAAAWAHPGSLTIAGPTTYNDPAYHTIAAGGGTVILYLDLILDGAGGGRYRDLLLNASQFGPAVPDWNGGTNGPTVNQWGNLNDIRVGSILQSKLPGLLDLISSENPHISGLFLDDLGSSGSWSLYSFNNLSAAEKLAYYNGSVAICQTARAWADANDCFLMANATWSPTAAGGNGGYPDLNKHGCSLVDGGFVEEHTVNPFWTNYCRDLQQWGTATPRNKAYMWASNEGDPTTAATWVSADLVAFMSSTGYSVGIQPPWKTTFTDFGLPNRAN